jgi:hypothetical protein
MLSRLLDWLFGKAEEINGRERCPTYLYRWTVAKWHGRGIYLHHFVDDDWSLDLHDHPKRFVSIGLKGGYVELTPCTQCDPPCDFENQTIFSAPWIRTFPAEHIHRLTMFRTDPTGAAKDCWTLVIVLKPTRSWGFWHRGKFIGWREYAGSELADRMKACD